MDGWMWMDENEWTAMSGQVRKSSWMERSEMDRRQHALTHSIPTVHTHILPMVDRLVVGGGRRPSSVGWNKGRKGDEVRRPPLFHPQNVTIRPSQSRLSSAARPVITSPHPQNRSSNEYGRRINLGRRLH